MKLSCKLSYEAEFDMNNVIAELIADGYAEFEAKEIAEKDIKSSIIDSIDTRADNKFWVPYKREYKCEWSEE